MANKKAINQQLLFLEILKALSSRHWKTQSQLRQVLSLRGYEIPERKLQRMLKDLRENEEFAVECDTRSRPFAYRRAVESDFESVNLSAGECLLLKLLEKHLKYLLPGSIKEVGFYKTATCGFFCPAYYLYYEGLTQRTSIELSINTDENEAQRIVDAFYNAIARAQN